MQGDEAVDTNHESLISGYLQENHSALYARGLQLSSDALDEHDVPQLSRHVLSQASSFRKDLAYLLLLSLEPGHLQHVLSAIQPLRSFDLLSLLPTELARLILVYLDPSSLVTCERVCKNWRKKVTDSLVWRSVYDDARFAVDTEAADWWCGYGETQQNIMHGGTHTTGLPTQLRTDEGLFEGGSNRAAVLSAGAHTPPPKSLYLPGVSSLHQSPDGKPQINYKHLYKLQVQAAHNIRAGHFRVHEISIPNTSHTAEEPPMYPHPPSSEEVNGVYCFQFHGNRLIAGGRADDEAQPYIVEWDMAAGQPVQCFVGHTASVLTLHFETGFVNCLITGSSDGCLIVWDLDTANIRAEIQAHEKSLLNLSFDSQAGLLCTASRDKTTKVWSMSNWECIHILRGHDSAVNSVELRGDLVATGSGDSFIKLWSARTGECLRTFSGHQRGVASIYFDGRHILSGGSDCSIRMHDIHEEEDSWAEPLLTPAQFGRMQQRRRVVTRYGYRTAMSEVHPTSTNSDLVRTVQQDRRFVMAGSYDRSIKVCDPVTGDLILSILGADTSAIFHLQFDAYRIVTSSSDGHLKIYDFLPEEEDKSFIA